MANKDVIIKIQGQQEYVQKAMDELIRELNEDDIQCTSQNIKRISNNLDKSLIKKTKTKDISICLAGKKENVKETLVQIGRAVYDELQITPNSEMIQIERKKDE